MSDFTIDQLNTVAQTIYDKKGCNILVLDVRGQSTLTDYFIIAEGSADRHVIALMQAVNDALKNKGVEPVHIEGDTEGDWVVMDYLHCIVHLFTSPMREKYRLEELWQAAKIVDVDISLSATNL